MTFFHPISIHTEKVNMPNTRRNLRTFAATNATFAEATKAETDFLMKENEQLENEFSSARSQIDHLLVENHRLGYDNSNMKELQATLFEGIQSLGDTM